MLKRIFLNLLFPFKWTLSKIRKGLNYYMHDNFYRINLVVLPNFLFSIVGITIVLYGFKNFKEDTTNLTNYGFAILAGIASICFSWIKVLDINKEPLMFGRVSNAAEGSFQCAITFILASALKYSSLHLEEFIPKSWTIIYLTFYSILGFTYGICFTFGFIKVDNILSDLNKLLYERLHLDIRN